MSLNITSLSAGTIPYPNFQNGQTMADNLFDENNDALLVKINELVASINNIKATLSAVTDGDSGADNISLTAITGVTGDTVQEAIENLKTLLDTAVLGAIPDGTITASKFHADALQAAATKLTETIATMYGLAGADMNVNKALEIIKPRLNTFSTGILYNAGTETTEMVGGFGTYKMIDTDKVEHRDASYFIKNADNLFIQAANGVTPNLGTVEMSHYKPILVDTRVTSKTIKVTTVCQSTASAGTTGKLGVKLVTMSGQTIVEDSIISNAGNVTTNKEFILTVPQGNIVELMIVPYVFCPNNMSYYSKMTISKIEIV